MVKVDAVSDTFCRYSYKNSYEVLLFENGMIKLPLSNTDLCCFEEGGRVENYKGPNTDNIKF